MPTIKADDGCELYFEMEGPANAPVLILCNSLGTTLHMWDEQVKTWAQHFRVVRYDRRGHGKSGVPKGPYTMERLGRDVLAIADHLGLKTFNWCGLSMGGMVGQWLGANAPDRVDKLVLSNTNYYYADKQPWNDRIKFVQDKGLGALADTMMERWFTKPFRDSSAAATDRIKAMFLGTKLEGFVACSQAVRDMDFRHSTPRITAPTLVIVGAKDPATLPEWGADIQKMIKGAKIISLEAAHISNVEQPKAYTEAVLNFLRG
ncbi:MAG: 3-oxoadipate enol-lactonase [Xanthobacteraceae bacterium]|jgi:3-oxoadipate enol-lactonase